jgi:hypothetical protein
MTTEHEFSPTMTRQGGRLDWTAESQHAMNAPALDLSRIADACAASDPAGGEHELVAKLRILCPELEFRRVLVRGGWHRPGGVVDLDMRRVAEHLREWAERESDGEVATLMDRYRGRQLFATSLAGKTHYLVASTGERAADFVQLEVEELQEVLDHYLNDPDWLPDSLEEFIDPLDYPRLEPEPVAAPRFVFRRLLPVADLIEALQDGNSVQDRLLRFTRDWDQSSAAGKTRFCEHWVLAVREYFDQYGIPHTSARPVATDTLTLPKPDAGGVDRGAALANQLHTFDRETGYPMAWYFHLLASPGAAPQIIPAVLEDHAATYDYLPPTDLAVLRRWLDSPYALV